MPALESEADIIKLYTHALSGHERLHDCPHPNAHPVMSHSTALTNTATATRAHAEVSKNGRLWERGVGAGKWESGADISGRIGNPMH